MDNSLVYIGGFIAGIISGLYYFGGLWWTVQKVPTSSSPRILLAVSFIARLFPIVCVMYFAARNNPGVFFTLLPGFFLIRMVMTRKIRSLNKESVHATQS